MNLTHYPYIPKYVVLRRYGDVNIYDLNHDDSFIIDEEAFSVLKLIDGKTNTEDIIQSFDKEKQDDIKEALGQFEELNLVKFNTARTEDHSKIYIDHLSLPQNNPFDPPYLKNLMINITERCNLTCKHCYITEKNKIDMSLEYLMDIIRDFYTFQGIRLILTGGEPFLYSNLEELLTQLLEIPLQKVILTNGVLIPDQDDKMIKLLKQNHVEIFVSLDGLEHSHNDFRDAACFNSAIEGIKRLLNAQISVSVNTMIHKGNLNDFEGMKSLLRTLEKIKNWSIDIPTFNDSTPQEILEKYQITPEEGGKILKNYGWGVIYELEPEGERFNYACGPYLMAVDVMGKITKCGFFYDQSPGNIFEIGLEQGWKLVQKSLNWNINELKCKELECEYLGQCRGGCRYRAYKYTKTLNGRDPYKCRQFGKKFL